MTNLKKSDCTIETMRGTGPGGQHRNKTDSAVRITHKPTGLSAYADERSQSHSKKKAWAELAKRIRQAKDNKAAKARKKRRDEAIHNTPTIRTYDYKSGVVRDHRTKKVAPLKDVLVKGKIGLLQ